MRQRRRESSGRVRCVPHKEVPVPVPHGGSLRSDCRRLLHRRLACCVHITVCPAEPRSIPELYRPIDPGHGQSGDNIRERSGRDSRLHVRLELRLKLQERLQQFPAVRSPARKPGDALLAPIEHSACSQRTSAGRSAQRSPSALCRQEFSELLHRSPG